MSTYATVTDVRREFKSVLDKGTVVTDDKILDFLLQANSEINSYIGTRYTVPISGTVPVNQITEITITTAIDATLYVVSVLTNGVTKTHSFTSGSSATKTTIRDGIIAKINSDKDRLVEASTSGTDKLLLESRVIGILFVVTLNANMTQVDTQTSVLGSLGLRLLRKIEGELASCKIARILRVKVAKALDKSEVRQDIKDGSCAAQAFKQILDIQDGKIILEDAALISPSGGLESHNQLNNFEPFFDIEKKQW